MTPPEYRRDPLSGRWVIVAPVRAGRPDALAGAGRDDSAACPFCEGNEELATPEVYAVRPAGSPANGPGWTLRVIPNRYPAVGATTAGDGKTAGLNPAARLSLFQSAPAVGTHELVIECPRHEANPARLSPAEVAAVLRAYRDRLAVLAADPRHAYISIFKNVGAKAGASLAHLHSQILATAIVPDDVQRAWAAAAAYHDRHGRCLLCDLLADEIATGVRVVATTTGFVAFCPFAPRFPYEMWVLPTAHAARYESLTDPAAADLGGLLHGLFGALDRVLHTPPFNLALHTAGCRIGEPAGLHWFFELLPRLTRPAGFEWGTGAFINPVPPERAAAELRAALPAAASRLH